MKNITRLLFCSILLVAVSINSHAQRLKSVTPTKTSLTLSADTANATLPIDNTTKSVIATATKTSGSVAGKIYFLGSIDNSNWDKIDSLVVTNISGKQYKNFTIRYLEYPYYKFQYLSTGGVWAITGQLHLRSGY